MNLGLLRTRWAAVGAAVAVTLGAGGLGITHATSPAGAVAFVPITPCRIADTRPAPDNVGPRSTPIGAGEILTISAHGDNGNCTGIPTSATGLSLNVTAIGATSGSFLTIWATGATQPTASSLNPQPGAPPIPNAVTTGISASGQFDIFNAVGSVNVLVDVVGYYTAHTHSSADITNEPGVADTFMRDIVDVLTTPVSVASTAMRVPSDGFVKIEVTGNWINNTGATDTTWCQLQKGAVAEVVGTTEPWFILTDRNTSAGYAGFSAHRIVPVSASDNPLAAFSGQVFRLVCDTQAGGARFDDVYISATFFSTSYEPQIPVLELDEGPTLVPGADAAAG